MLLTTAFYLSLKAISISLKFYRLDNRLILNMRGCGGYIDRYGYPYCRGRIFDIVEEDTGWYDENVALDWASGAAMVIKKTLFKELGGFDEDFEMHMEEIDFMLASSP